MEQNSIPKQGIVQCTSFLFAVFFHSLLVGWGGDLLPHLRRPLRCASGVTEPIREMER